MTTPVTQLPGQTDVNADYLARGLHWLRQLLQDATGDALDERWWEDAQFVSGEQLPALEDLALRLQLSRFETLVLLLCIAYELDPRIPELCSAALGDPHASAPTLGLALATLPDPAWDVVSAYRPLRHWRLVQIHQTVDRPLTSSPLQADERVVNYAKGLNELDQRLTHWLAPLRDPWSRALVESHALVVSEVVRGWTETAPGESSLLVQLVGPDPRVRRSLAAAAGAGLGLSVYELQVSRLPASSAELAELTRLLERESLLLPLAVYLDVTDLPPTSEDALRSLCAVTSVPFVVGGVDPFPHLGDRSRVVDAARPTLLEQEALWVQFLGEDNSDLAAKLADHFDFDPSTIEDCARTAVWDQAWTARGEGPALLDESAAAGVWAFCRDQARPSLATLAHRIEPAATWDDLVLAEPETTALHQLADQVRGRPTVLREWGLAERHGRGAGITALFAGASGTGKTLAAEVLANDLDLTLCRIDLSGVVSKYIGETERNLREVFDAAERGGALLFFDEADALFGKRSEVRDSHDRYANIEVNYLLQRMEAFSGLAVLATNQRNALDTAFLRRLRMIITFPFPSPTQRRRMWQLAFSAGAPVGRLDLDRLAELPATGGMIRNIALNAAYCAAGRDSSITMPLVLDMARTEFKKLDLPLAHTHFADQEASHGG